MALLAMLALLLGLPAMTLSGDAGTTRAVRPAGKATVTIAAMRPLTVVGRAFKSGEHVRVTAQGQRKSVIAGARGGFKISFPRVNTCDGVIVVARGSERSRASVTFAQFSNVHCLEP